MKVIIVGCGKIGAAVIENLVAEGHDVVAIDNDPEVVNEITNLYDVMSICGNGADSDTLAEAGAENAALFISVTGSDELNMIACFLAKKMGAEHTIARIRNPEYNDDGLNFMRNQFELDMAINPEKLTANELRNILKLPSAIKVENFSKRNLEMIEIRLGPTTKLSGMTIMKMREKHKANYLISSVERDGEIFIPDGNFELKSGDRLGITASPDEMEKLLRMVGLMKKEVKSVIIFGGSRISFYLAKNLERSRMHVTILEKDSTRAKQLSEELNKTYVINGNGIHQDLLMEEGLRSADAFVALTGIDEENILMSVFAAMQKVPTVISKINRPELISLAEKIGVECVVTPQKITSNIIVRYARAIENSFGSNVETLYKLMDGRAEVLEFIAKEGSRTLNIDLKDITLKKNILITGIMRGRETIIPSGSDHIEADDRVIVIAAGQRLNDLDDILKKSEYTGYRI